ncbi:hypothetical protein C8Q79DRAFT_766218 [Trametes meyenii]|nr:hypothetical protein C8Q79DRAFT_766218 [Trametes meyenii]
MRRRECIDIQSKAENIIASSAGPSSHTCSDCAATVVVASLQESASRPHALATSTESSKANDAFAPASPAPIRSDERDQTLSPTQRRRFRYYYVPTSDSLHSRYHSCPNHCFLVLHRVPPFFCRVCLHLQCHRCLRMGELGKAFLRCSPTTRRPAKASSSRSLLSARSAAASIPQISCTAPL